MCQVVELSSVKCSSSFFGHSQMWWATSPIHLIANQPSFAKCYSFAKALKHYNYIHSTSQLFQGNARLLTIHFIHPQLGMWPIATEKLVVAKKTLSQLQQPPLLHLMAPWQHAYGIHRGAFFVWRAPIVSWPRIMCSQVRVLRFLEPSREMP